MKTKTFNTFERLLSASLRLVRVSGVHSLFLYLSIFVM